MTHDIKKHASGEIAVITERRFTGWVRPKVTNDTQFMLNLLLVFPSRLYIKIEFPWTDTQDHNHGK